MPDLLTLWEKCSAIQSHYRADRLLAAAHPDRVVEDMTVGEHDALLLQLRTETFGDVVHACATCPRCGCSVECSLGAKDLLVAGSSPASSATALEIGDYRLDLRAPTCRDLREASQAQSAEDAFSVLLERCVTRAHKCEEQIEVRDLPEPVLQMVSERLSELDPQADLSLQVGCPECMHSWSMSFDIGAFVWEEIAAGVPRLLRQVHALARAYGWREADILAMSPMRRQMYLETLDAG